ncbi:MAG: beta-propeller domain-containing protein [Polyangiaceae bacterium]|nr:beta-propeller domain-containing protein [Polyangiaceae bacterium]
MFLRKFNFMKWSLVSAAALLGSAAMGCADIEPPQGGGGFVSDSPFGNNGKNDDEGGGDTATGAGGGSGDPATDGGGDGEKAILEADIIQVDGNKLFALSQYGGLSVVDMTDPNQLSIIGHYDIQGVPFEMYMRDGVVYAMFSSFGRWECDEDYTTCEYISSSHIEALNVTNPANIIQIGSFDLPGEISDSRIVGDVLYAVSYENGYCWNCADAPTTTVTSINVADPADIAVVDSVGFDSSDPYGYGWGRRSVTVTQDRMFIAGIEWDGNDEGHSTIQIVDIADPTGVLHVGAAVEAAGMIESRWQMDEHNGVLRVISQPGVWWSNGVPQVQTFQINSSDSVTPMAVLDMVLPMPERLRSARFDGTKLYAITAEQTDPLFTLDLSNPAQPVQVGELEIPGWVYHLEPRGDRIYALGFDNQNAEGSMNVSLFDVSNFAQPTLVERIAFGGDWSWAPEDQDRIHKAFKIDSDLGAIFVPYGAWEYNENDGYYGCGHIDSGIQIIDFTQDSLTKRGVAPLNGFARRALIHNGNLFSVSDSEVAAYNIANRDAPAMLDSIALSSWVNQSVRVGNNLVRVAADWWTNAAALDVVPASDPGRTEPLGTLNLKDIVGTEDQSDCYGWGYFYGAQLFALNQERVAIAWSTYDYYWGYEDGSGGSYTPKTHVAVVNIANPSQPTVEGRLSLPFATDMYPWWGSLDGGNAIVQIGSRLVFRRVLHPAWDSSDLEKAWIEVVETGVPGTPTHVASVPLPDGFGHSLLIKNGFQVLTSHWEPVAGTASKVKFYLDRVAVPPVAQPSGVVSINVPGSLLAYDEQSSHALTVDFKKKQVIVPDYEACYSDHGWNAWIEDIDGVSFCTYMEQTLKLIDVSTPSNVDILDSELLSDSFYFYGTKVTESRVFAEGYSYNPGDNYGTYSIMVIGDVGGDQLNIETVNLDQDEYLWPVAAETEHLVLTSWNEPGIHVLDTTDMNNMTLEKKGEVTSYVYAVTLDNDQALCALGPYGLEVVDLQ